MKGTGEGGKEITMAAIETPEEALIMQEIRAAAPEHMQEPLFSTLKEDAASLNMPCVKHGNALNPSQVKARRHHNNKAHRSTLRGKRRLEVVRIAKRLNVPYSSTETDSTTPSLGWGKEKREYERTGAK